MKFWNTDEIRDLTFRLPFQLEAGESVELRAFASRAVDGGVVEGELCLTTRRLIFDSAYGPASFELRRDEIRSARWVNAFLSVFGGMLPWMRSFKLQARDGREYVLKSFLSKRFFAAIAAEAARADDDG